MQILRQLTLQNDRADRQLQNVLATPRLRAVNCKAYVFGQDWHNWVVYFRENVRATGNFAHNDPRLDQACCSWLGGKLEPGATLNAYQNLPQATKDNWTDVTRELARLFCNEEEKQLFLSNPGAFRKGEKSFLEYRNELTRRIDLYQPELSRVQVEYQRQLVNRFIEGIEDVALQRKLRFHCRRNMTLDAAYEYAVDYEATQVEEKVKEVAVAASATTGLSSDVKVKSMRDEIEQLKVAFAQVADGLRNFKQEVSDELSRLNGRLDIIESLITTGQSAGPQSLPPP